MQHTKYKVKRPLRTIPGNVTVYEAEQTALKRGVEIRVLNQFVGKDDDTYLRFEREFKTIARLDHPHCVKIFDWGLSDDKIYYVAEKRPALPLDELLQQGKGPSPEEVFLLGAQVAEALAYLHAQGIVHRDLGPSSIYWAPQKRAAFIAHFTMVKNLKLEDLTAKGVGHVAPLAFTPEQGSGGEIDERTDIFLLGSLLYLLLTGEDPIPVEQVLGNPGAAHTIVPPSKKLASLETRVDEILLKAMARDPAERYQTAEELAGLLREYHQRMESRKAGRTSRTAAVKVTGAVAAVPPASGGGTDASTELASTDLTGPAVAPGSQPAALGQGPGEGALRAAGLGSLVERLGAPATWCLVIGSGVLLALLVSLLF